MLKDDLAPALAGVTGVARLELSGAQDEYVRIVIDEASLKQYHLSIASVGAAIQAADFDMPLGDVKIGSQEVALSAYGNIDVSSQLMRDIPIETPSRQVVRLSDVTSYLNLVREDADTLSRYNGEESYLLEITKKSSASTLTACKAVERILRQYEAEGGLTTGWSLPMQTILFASITRKRWMQPLASKEVFGTVKNKFCPWGWKDVKYKGDSKGH